MQPRADALHKRRVIKQKPLEDSDGLIAMERSMSDTSSRSHLLCEELLDPMMAVERHLDWTPSTVMSLDFCAPLEGSFTTTFSLDSAAGGEPAPLDSSCADSESAASSSSSMCEGPSGVTEAVGCWGMPLLPLPRDCLIQRMAHTYGFTRQCTQIGTSYFQRLAARDARLMWTAACHVDFAPLVQNVLPDVDALSRPLASELLSLMNPKQWLMVLHLTCTYLAAKNIDKVMHQNLLVTMLSHAHNRWLPARVATGLEIEVLQALRWRLGPFFHSLPSCCPSGAQECTSSLARRCRQG